MTDADYFRLEETLNALFAQHGQERLVAFALACAAFVLPLYEASAPDAPSLRCALRRDPSDQDVQRAKAATRATWVSQPDWVFQAAATVLKAIRMAFDLQAGTTQDARRMTQALSCVQSAECAVARALEAGSAQERLDLLGRLEGHTSLEAMLLAWLAEPAPLWQDRLANRTGGTA